MTDAATLLDDVFDAVLDYDAARAVELARGGIAVGIPVDEILADGVIPALAQIVDQYGRGECYLVDLFNGGRVVDEVLAALAPELEATRAGRTSSGTVVLGLIAPNVQEMGKNIVAIMLRGYGFDVVDLGTNVPPERFAEAVAEQDADVVAVSVMTDAGIPALARLLDLLRAGGLTDGRLVMCGGAATTPEIAAQLGVRRGRDAAGAVALVREHMAARP